MKFIPITYRILMDHSGPQTVTGFAFDSGTGARLCVRFCSDAFGHGWRVDHYDTGAAIPSAGVDHATSDAAANAGIVCVAYCMGTGQWDKALQEFGAQR